MPVASANYVPTVQRRRALVASLTPVVARTGTPGPSLVARLRPVPSVRRAIHTHGIVRIDDCGRLRDASAFATAGFVAGSPVKVTVTSGRAIVELDTSSDVVIDARGRLTLSETHRKLLGLASGDLVVVSAPASGSSLVIQPTDVLDQVVS